MKNLSFSRLETYGRLGNQLFEAASTIGLAKRYTAKPILPEGWEYRKQCSLPDEYFGAISQGVEVQETKFEYTPNLLEDVKHFDSVNITGVLQSTKYFSEIEEEIKEWLRPAGVTYNGDYSVGVHVRRGDYVLHPCYVQYGPEYYLSVIQAYFSDPNYKFYICSDDPDYCKEHFVGDQYIIQKQSPVQDLVTLASCRHHIIPNSTFGWWGTYLSPHKGINVRPPKIFRGRMDNYIEDDYWVDNWICHTEKTDLTDVTFIIPVKYDHPDRKENLRITVDFLQRAFNTNIIIGEQGGACFKDLQCGYVQFPYKEFHRTKMLNRMTELSKTPIVVNWDADVLFSPFQVFEMVEMLRGDYDFVYPYDGRFLRVGEGTYARVDGLIDKVRGGDVGNLIGHKFVGDNDQSVGGAIGYRKQSFVDAGMENENFIAYTPEDVERKYRYDTLGFKIGRTFGPLYHLNHYCGPFSTTSNPFYKTGLIELDKVRSMNKTALRNYIKTWEWVTDKKVYLVCYADDKFKEFQDRLVGLANESGMFDGVFRYDRAWLENTSFYKKNKKLLDEEKGGGNCAWKPYVIKDAMSKIEDRDIILYMDSADVFNGDIRSFLLNEKHPIVLTNGAFKNSDWTKMDCFVEMGCASPKYMNAIQLEAGVGIFSKTEEVDSFINEWQRWCKNSKAVSAIDVYENENTEGYKEHRYDQSVLTNLKIKHGIYSSGDIREFVTCNVKLSKEIKTSVTFIIPLFYDGNNRKKNIEYILKYYQKFSPKIIIGEQLDKKFEYLPCDQYVYFDDKQFHRTKMINKMTVMSETDIIVVCDADVIIPEQQYYEAIRLIVEDNVDVVYPYTNFIKLTNQETLFAKETSNFEFFTDNKGFNSKGGMIFFRKESYIKGGMENEKFMIWGYEDFERYHRFVKLGYNVESISGNLYHLYHHTGPNSSYLNEHYNENKKEFIKIKEMDVLDLRKYVSTWEKHEK